MWQMKATATNTRPGSMEEEPDMENKQGDNPSQHKMRGWRTAALREQGQSSGTLTNEHNTNKQKNHSNKRHSKSSTESGQTNTQSLNQDARRVQGDNPGQPAKNNPTNKKRDKPEGNKQSSNNFMVPHAQLNTNDKSGRNKSIQSPWGSCLTSHARPSAEW